MMQPGEVLEAASLKDGCRFPCHTHLYSLEAWGECGIPLCMAVPLEERLWGEPRGRGNSLGHGDCPSFKPLNTHRSHKASGRAKKLKESNCRDESILKSYEFPKAFLCPRLQSAGAFASPHHSNPICLMACELICWKLTLHCRIS